VQYQTGVAVGVGVDVGVLVSTDAGTPARLGVGVGLTSLIDMDGRAAARTTLPALSPRPERAAAAGWMAACAAVLMARTATIA